MTLSGHRSQGWRAAHWSILTRINEPKGGQCSGVAIGLGQRKPRSKMTKPLPLVPELARVGLPLAFVSLVAAAVAGVTTPLFFAIVLSAGLVIVVIRALFPCRPSVPSRLRESDCGLRRYFLSVC